MSRPRRVETIAVDGVVVPSGRRPLDEGALANLVTSIKQIGLQMPICVRPAKNVTDADGVVYDAADVLVCGGHRLEAVRRLGWEAIEAFVEDIDEVDAELWEISENLHRSELTTLERDEQVARWISLTEKKVLAQTEPKPLGGRPEGGIRAAARELGVDRNDAARALKVAALSDEAKAAARDAGLDDNRSVLLEAAKAEPSRQAAVIREIAEAKSSGIDAELRKEAARNMAAWLAEHSDASQWEWIKSTLYTAGAKAVADAFVNETGAGVSVMDRRFG